MVSVVRSRRPAFAGLGARPALRPVKLAFARRIGAVPRSRRAIPAIAVPLRIRTVEATLALPPSAPAAFDLSGRRPGSFWSGRGGRSRPPAAPPRLGPKESLLPGAPAWLKCSSTALGGVRPPCAFRPPFRPGCAYSPLHQCGTRARPRSFAPCGRGSRCARCASARAAVVGGDFRPQSRDMFAPAFGRGRLRGRAARRLIPFEPICARLAPRSGRSCVVRLDPRFSRGLR